MPALRVVIEQFNSQVKVSHGCREKGNFPDCCIASTTSRMCATCLVWLVLRVFDGDAAVAWLKGHTSAQAPRAQYRLSSYRDDHSRHLLSGDVRERVCHAPCQVSKVLASRQLNDPVIHHRGFSTPDH